MSRFSIEQSSGTTIDIKSIKKVVLAVRSNVYAIAASLALKWPIAVPTGGGGWIWTPEMGNQNRAYAGSHLHVVGPRTRYFNWQQPLSLATYPDLLSATNRLARMDVAGGMAIRSMDPVTGWQRIAAGETLGDTGREEVVTEGSVRSVEVTDPRTGLRVTIMAPSNYANALREARGMSSERRALVMEIRDMAERIGGALPFVAAIVPALGWREGRLNAEAENPVSHALGPFQMMPAVYNSEGIDPRNWRACVPVVTAILRRGLRAAPEGSTGSLEGDEFERMTWALLRYARGPGFVRDHGMRPDEHERAMVMLEMARIMSGFRR